MSLARLIFTFLCICWVVSRPAVANHEPPLTEAERVFLAGLKSIRVSNENNWPPIDFVSNNKPTGYAIDYLELIASRLQLKFTYINGYSWGELLSMAKQGELDIIHSIAKNTEREEFLSFSTPFLDLHSVIITRNDQEIIKTLEHLKGKTLAIIPSYNSQQVIQQQYPTIRLVRVESPLDGLKAVSTGLADAYVDKQAVANYLINKNLLSNLKIVGEAELKNTSFTKLHIGIRADWPLLKTAIDKAIADISEEELLALRSKWMGLSQQEIPKPALFDQQEQAYLDSKKGFTMCVDPGWPPFEWIDNKNQHRGIVAQTMRLFEQKLGKPLTLKVTSNWSETLAKAKAKECDIISAAAATPSREKYLTFGENYMKIPVVLVTRAEHIFIGNYSQITEHPVGIVSDYAILEKVRSEHPDANIVEVDSVLDGLNRVSSGEIFAFMDTVASVSYFIKEGKLNNVKISGATDYTWTLGVATQKGDHMMRQVFDKATRAIDKAEHDKIFNNWINIKFEHTLGSKRVWQVSGIVLLVLLIISWWNRKLASVNEKVSAYVKIINSHVLNTRIDLDGKIYEISDALCNGLGYNKWELVGNSFVDLFIPITPEQQIKQLSNYIALRLSWQGELDYLCRNGQVLKTETYLSPTLRRGQVVGFTVIQQDITDKKRIEKMTITDELTGLYNRRHFNHVFAKERNRARRDKKFFAFILLDVDNFKKFNDSYGHPQGDQALIAIANVFKGGLRRSGDYVFRLGGEEFGIIISTANSVEEITQTAHKIKDAVQHLGIKHIGNPPYNTITLCMGIKILSPKVEATAEQIYFEADKALYRAKEQNRNAISLATTKVTS